MAIDVMTILWVAVAVLLGSFVFAIYHFFFAPRSSIPGQYLNPKIGRRPISSVQTPDMAGVVRALVDEEDEGKRQAKCSIFVEHGGQTHLIHGVDVDRDIECYNKKQAIAGADPPIWVCSIDRNGQRHPGYLKQVTGQDEDENIRLADLQAEVERLMRDFARLKQQMSQMSTDEGIQDRIQELTDNFSRLRQTMVRFPTDSDYDNDEEEPEKKGRR